MRNLLILLALLSLMPITGCKSTVDTFDYSSLASPILATGAGVLAYQFTKDEENEMIKYGVPIGAAVGTYLISEAVRYKIFMDFDEQVAKGYALGTADGMKRQAKIFKNLKHDDDNAQLNTNVKFYTFPGVENADGVKYVPHNVKVRHVE